MATLIDKGGKTLTGQAAEKAREALANLCITLRAESQNDDYRDDGWDAYVKEHNRSTRTIDV